MQEDDLNEGIQKIKDILQKLETRAHEEQLLKEFPRVPHTEKPGTILPEPLPHKVNCPKCGEEIEVETLAPGEAAQCPKCAETGTLPETRHEAPVEAAQPESPAVHQNTGQPSLSEPENKTETSTEASIELKAEEPRLEIRPVHQNTEQLPKSEPENEAEPLQEIPAAVPAEEPKPEAQAVQQNPEQPPLSEPESVVVKRTTGLKMKVLAGFCLGLAVAAAAYQFGYNSSKYNFKQASRLEENGDKAGAVSAYQRLILKYPGTAEAAASQYAIGNIKSGQGEPGAIEYYRKFVSMAPAGDVKIPDAKFQIAESRFKDGALSEAAGLYDDAAIRASVYSGKAAERLNQIKTAEAQVAEAQKQLAADPAKAVDAYSAVLIAYPGYAEAKAGLEEARKQQLQVRPGRAAAVAPAKAGAAARANLARSILMANRKRLGAHAPANAKALKTTSIKDRYTACSPVWLAEKNQANLDAGLSSAKNNYDCDALKGSLAVCEGAGEKMKAIKAQTAEVRAAKVKSVVPDWTAQKQEALDNKMLKLYEENHCAEFPEISAQSEGEEAPEGF